jgi:hypothetical protein
VGEDGLFSDKFLAKNFAVIKQFSIFGKEKKDNATI